MLQQLTQSSGGSPMMQMGMLPSGFTLPGAQNQGQGSIGQTSQSQQTPSGLSGMNPMSLQGSGLGQMGGQMGNQSFNDMMRQQQAIQEMMRKNGMFMPGMGGLGGMGGMGGMFMPPKKDDEDKKWFFDIFIIIFIIAEDLLI